MRFGFFSLTPHAGNVSIEVTLATALVARGDEAFVVQCDGQQARCIDDAMSAPGVPRAAQCQQCYKQSAQLSQAWSAAKPVVMSSLVDRAREGALHQAIKALPDDALFECVLAGFPFGEWVQVGLHWEYFGERWRRLEGLHDKARAWLMSMATTLVAVERFIEVYRPDAIVTWDGLRPSQRVVIEAGRRAGVRSLSFDSCQVPGGVEVCEGSPVFAGRNAEAWRHWRTVPLSAAENARLDQCLLRRQHTSHDPMAVYAYSPDASGRFDEVRRQLQLRPEAPLLTAFTNTTAEVSMLFAGTAFPSQSAWLDACLEYARAYPAIDLVIRVHPAELVVVTIRAGQYVPVREMVAADLQARWPTLPENVRLLGPESPVSSYDLMAISRVVLVYLSSTGMEAAAQGLPVVCAGTSHYQQSGATWPVPTADAFAPLLDRLIADPQAPPSAQELMRRYLYLWFFRAVAPVEVLHPDFAFRRPQPRYRSLADLAPGANPVLDHLCDHLRGTVPRVMPPTPWRPQDNGQIQSTAPVAPQVAIVLAAHEIGTVIEACLPKALAASPRLGLTLLVTAGDPTVVRVRLADALQTDELPTEILTVQGPNEALIGVLMTASCLLATADAGCYAVESLAQALGLPIWDVADWDGRLAE